MVPLRQVAEIVETTSPQIIKRQELQRRVALYANVEGGPSGDVNSDVQKIIKEMSQLPPGYRFDVGGQQKDMQESFAAAVAALGLAVIFIYLILASQFASFTQPVAIMASLPFSLIGVFLALLLTGTTLNIFSIIGFIMLMGLVTKNAILLVDFANRARRAGASLHDALLQAGQVRLRPILMTTAAMIGGMLPLALGLGEGGETQAPMGRAIIGGVITSTLLTLVVVPVLYTYLDALAERRRKRARRKAARREHAAAGAWRRGRLTCDNARCIITDRESCVPTMRLTPPIADAASQRQPLSPEMRGMPIRHGHRASTLQHGRAADPHLGGARPGRPRPAVPRAARGLRAARLRRSRSPTSRSRSARPEDVAAEVEARVLQELKLARARACSRSAPAAGTSPRCSRAAAPA